jgi:hypothetical protein
MTRLFHSMSRARTVSFSFLVVLTILFAAPSRAFAEQPSGTEEKQKTADASSEEFKRFKVVFEPDAYYSDIDLIIALTKTPLPHLGQKSEAEIYATLLSRAALLPQFLVLEASVNPMPYFGTYLKEHNRDFYDHAQVSGSFNWVKAVTAGFEEPYAVSFLAGNVATFDIPGSSEAKGLGYSGYLFSAGNYHIKSNELVQDEWREYEWKMKGDMKTPDKKLSWSYRFGAKIHGNPYITDIFYVSVRRSRLDYKPMGSSLFYNSGFEYTYDMDRRTFNPIRHYFYVDKKWPIEGKQMALSLALGFVWESAKKYSGPLAAGRTKDNFQFILRPNLEF